jgi:hypothetical protein
MRHLLAIGLVLVSLFGGTVASANDSVDSYKSFSFGLTSGMDLMGGPLLSLGPGISGLYHSPTANHAGGLIGINGSARLMISSIQLGAQMGVYFSEATDTVIVPGGNVGYAIGLIGPLSLTPSARALFLVPSARGSSVTMQLTGEVALEWFFGKNGYLEPYFAAGALHATGANQALFIIGGGYRLGIVFF